MSNTERRNTQPGFYTPFLSKGYLAASKGKQSEGQESGSQYRSLWLQRRPPMGDRPKQVVAEQQRLRAFKVSADISRRGMLGGEALVDKDAMPMKTRLDELQRRLDDIRRTRRLNEGQRRPVTSIDTSKIVNGGGLATDLNLNWGLSQREGPKQLDKKQSMNKSEVMYLPKLDLSSLADNLETSDFRTRNGVDELVKSYTERSNNSKLMPVVKGETSGSHTLRVNRELSQTSLRHLRSRNLVDTSHMRTAFDYVRECVAGQFPLVPCLPNQAPTTTPRPLMDAPH